MWLFLATAHAATYRVCSWSCMFQDIGDALQIAQNGDTISVDTGTYSEQLTISKGVIIEAEDGPGTVRVRGSGGSTIVTVLSPVPAKLVGLRIDGQNSRRGIQLLSGTLQLENATVENGYRSSDFGGGVSVAPGATLVLTDTVFQNNKVRYSNGGHAYVQGTLLASGTTIFQGGKTEYSGDGGGVYVRAGSATFDGTVFQDNTAFGDGGALYLDDSDATCAGCTFVDNDAGDTGGSIAFNGEGRSLTLAANVFDGGTTTPHAKNGGGIGLITGALAVTGSTFQNLVARDRGGAVYANAETDTGSFSLTVTDSSFTNNSAIEASADGGAVYVSDTHQDPLLFDTCTFTDNEAVDIGGAIRTDGGPVIVNDSTFSGGSADTGGHIGALRSTDLTLSGCDFGTGNATSNGGSLKVGTSSTATVTDTTFTSNHAYNGGAVAFDGGKTGTFADVTFTGNAADNAGGHLYLDGSGVETVTLYASTLLEEGSATTGGAAYLLTNAVLLASGTRFERNEAESGGAIASAGTIDLDEGAEIADNTAQIGGGVYVLGTASLDGVLLTGNTSFGFGGALYVDISGDLDLFDSRVEHNAAGWGAGVFGLSASIDLVRNAFCDNNAQLEDSGTGGAVAGNGATVTAHNNRFVYNRASQDGGAVWVSSGWLSATHNLFLWNTATDGSGLWVTGAGGAVADNLLAYDQGGAAVDGDTGNGALELHTNAWYDNPGGHVGAAFDLDDEASVDVDPLLTDFSNDGDCTNDSLWLRWDSPLVDVDSAESDPDGSVADLGAWGGPHAPTDAFVDQDDDGWIVIWDCDDADPGRNHGLLEVAGDGVDQDCDGAELCYADPDDDGYGSDIVLETDLDCGELQAIVAGDCDDEHGDVNPGAEEQVANGVDDDCDAVELCFADADDDGFGWETAFVPSDDLACDGPDEASNADDCDDDDAERAPDQVEVADDGKDEDCDGAELCWADGDLDGFGGGGIEKSRSDFDCDDDGEAHDSSDCDDADTEVHPDADESPADGFDGNCDGTEECYADADGDGHGVADAFVLSEDIECMGGVGAPTADDCDDTNPDISPSAPEGVADDLDSNCDGDERCWKDGDGDGHGGDTSKAVQGMDCDGSGVSWQSTDCDDEDADIHPDAVEGMADGIDGNCDGEEACWLDLDGDGYGDPDALPVSVASMSCEGDFASNEADDCDDGDGDVHPDADEAVADGVDADCNGLELCYTDKDGDGWGTSQLASTDVLGCNADGLSTVSGDCDDASGTVNPLATEVPADAVDQDCDGSELCLADADGDGFGASREVEADLLCADPGVTAAGGDCDDDEQLAWPGGTEVCDGVDNDCDGTTDVGATDAAPWYVDADGDGFGVGEQAVGCGGPNLSAETGDCDDGDPGAHPGATETWYDGVDQDCDGNDDDRDGDGHPGPTDCDDDDPNVHPGATEATDGADRDCDGYSDPTTVSFRPVGCATASASPAWTLWLLVIASVRRPRDPRRHRRPRAPAPAGPPA